LHLSRFGSSTSFAFTHVKAFFLLMSTIVMPILNECGASRREKEREKTKADRTDARVKFNAIKVRRVGRNVHAFDPVNLVMLPILILFSSLRPPISFYFNAQVHKSNSRRSDGISLAQIISRILVSPLADSEYFKKRTREVDTI